MTKATISPNAKKNNALLNFVISEFAGQDFSFQNPTPLRCRNQRIGVLLQEKLLRYRIGSGFLDRGNVTDVIDVAFFEREARIVIGEAFGFGFGEGDHAACVGAGFVGVEGA